MQNPETYQAMRLAAERLHHLSMRYSGALVELVEKQPVGLLAQDHPGLKECRDFIDLILFTRAEINALTRLLVEATVFSTERFTKQVAKEYEWFAQEKAKQLGVGLTDYGITFSVGPKPEGN